MRLQPGKEQRLMSLGHVRSTAAAARDEAGPHDRCSAPRLEPLGKRFPDHRRGRPPFPLRVQLQVAFRFRCQENRRPFHMTYDIIP